MATVQRLGETFIAEPPKELLLPDGFTFAHGETIAPFTIVYETFGQLNADRSNAILVCHALSASAHAASIKSVTCPNHRAFCCPSKPQRRASALYVVGGSPAL